jgi:addiction module HigA family antidote
MQGSGHLPVTAKELGVSAPTVNEIVRRRRAVTTEMALRLARYFGTTAQLWQNLQSQYDLACPDLTAHESAS